ncbi:MAG TPA: 2-phospho-L-lactate guanylyltransferase [Thermomicrobiales bacterium]|nr:2-phospho-L-lactate guanylyltransferase [Thermomicrobiales bacterium]
MNSIAALVPIRNRVDGKRRLSAEFHPSERRILIETMARHVVKTLVRSGIVTQVMVISRDPDFIDDVLPDIDDVALIYQAEHAPGLNAGLELGRQWALVRGVSRLLILSGDLPLLTDGDVHELGSLSRPVILATDRSGRGTNGLVLNQHLSPEADLIARFPFRFGVDSLGKHAEEAARLGIPAEVVLTPGTGHDLDTPEDWKVLDPGTRERLLPHDPCIERSRAGVHRIAVPLAAMECS